MSENINAASSRTENDALTRLTSGSKLVDMFDAMGGLRHDPQAIIGYFEDAWKEDKLISLKLMFLLRNPRGGMGERTLFKVLLAYLVNNPDPEKRQAVVSNMALLPELGRWDDLLTVFCFGNVPVSKGEDSPSKMAAKLLVGQLEQDALMVNDHPDQPVSLLAKWLPSENASSKQSRQIARKLMKAFGYDTHKYRQTLKSIRNHLGDGCVEVKMSEKRFSDIDYGKVCSKAGLTYRNAFQRQDETRYKKWLEDVSTGDAKVNVGALHPHEITYKAAKALPDSDEAKALDNQWNTLVEEGYVESDEDIRALPVIDVSWSMKDSVGGNSKVECIDVSTGLGLYMSASMSGPFKGHFLTFSETPTLEKMTGDNIVEITKNCLASDWGGSTDLQATFDLLIDTARQKELMQEEMPTHLYIVTDGEFDPADRHVHFGDGGSSNERTNYEAIKAKFADAGYEMPVVVFWNVQKRQRNVAMSSNDFGMLVSGFSPTLLQAVAAAKEITPYDCMIAAIGEGTVYDAVSL